MAHVYRNETERDALRWTPQPHQVAATITSSPFPLTTPPTTTTQVAWADPYLAADDRSEWLPTWLPLNHTVPCLHVLPEVIAEMTSVHERNNLRANIGDYRLATIAKQAKGTSMPTPNLRCLCEAAQAIQTLLTRHMVQNAAAAAPLTEVIEAALTLLQDAFAVPIARVWLAADAPLPLGERVIQVSQAATPDTLADALNALARHAYREAQPQHRHSAGVMITAIPLRHDATTYGALVVAHAAQPSWRDDAMPLLTLIAMQLTGVLAAEERYVAARTSERFWSAVADSPTDGFILYDKQHRITTYNQVALDLAMNRAEVIAARACGQTITPVWQTRWFNETEIAATDAPSMRAITTGTPTKATQVWVSGDANSAKTKTPVLVSAMPIVDDHAAIQGAVVRFQDITALKAVEALKLQRVKIVQHDVRQPLTLVLLRAQMLHKLADRLTPAKLREDAQSMEAACRFIDTELNSLTDLDKSVGAPPVRMSLVDRVWAYVHEQRQHYGTRHIECEIAAADSELEGCWVARDIDSLIDNLIQNAIKYSPDESPITVRLYPSMRADKPMAHMEVIDHGYGVPADDKIHIFENAFRSVKQAPNGRDIPGTGWGLYFCATTVKMHGGKIYVVSDGLGQGSTFHVELPLEK